MNDFRIDLVNYFHEKGEIKNAPFGLHAIVRKTDEFKEGVIFVLRNVNQGVNINNTNRLHPFYLVYIGKDKEIWKELQRKLKVKGLRVKKRCYSGHYSYHSRSWKP